jgi:GNAT superfamily N-acetyltransferase
MVLHCLGSAEVAINSKEHHLYAHDTIMQSHLAMIDLITIHDCEALAGLYQELSGETSEPGIMKENLAWIIANPDYYLIGARNETGELVGTLMGIVCRDIVKECRPFMVIENVIVSGRCRKKGIGRQLMNYIEEIGRSRNCYYTMFVSSAERKQAHRFYRSLGYDLDLVQGFKKYL